MSAHVRAARRRRRVPLRQAAPPRLADPRPRQGATGRNELLGPARHRPRRSGRGRRWRSSAAAAAARPRCCARSPASSRRDAGTIEVEGRVGALLSVGAGVMSPLTGRENAQLLGVLARAVGPRGATRDAERAGRERPRQLLRPPVSSYSQGMRRGSASRPPTRPTRRSSCSTRCTRRSTTSTARSSGACARDPRRRRDRRRRRSRPPAARAALEPGALARRGLDHRRRPLRSRAQRRIWPSPRRRPGVGRHDGTGYDQRRGNDRQHDDDSLGLVLRPGRGAARAES